MLPILPVSGRSRAQRDAAHRASAATNRAGKIGASRRVSAKIALWGVKALDRITRYAHRASPAIKRFSHETPLARIIQKVS
jgi:hypothetical protein